MVDGDFVEVFLAQDLPHAHMLVAILKNEGIEPIVDNEQLQGIIGAVPVGLSRPRVLVAAADAERAKQILEETMSSSDEDA